MLFACPAPAPHVRQPRHVQHPLQVRALPFFACFPIFELRDVTLRGAGECHPHAAPTALGCTSPHICYLPQRKLQRMQRRVQCLRVSVHPLYGGGDVGDISGGGGGGGVEVVVEELMKVVVVVHIESRLVCN